MLPTHRQRKVFCIKICSLMNLHYPICRKQRVTMCLQETKECLTNSAPIVEALIDGANHDYDNGVDGAELSLDDPTSGADGAESRLDNHNNVVLLKLFFLELILDAIK